VGTIEVLFTIAMFGYIIGNITFKGLQLGTSGVILIGLLFGHWGYEIPPVIQDLGLVLFVTTVGLTAGPTFFRNFRARAFSFAGVGIGIIAAGAGVAWVTAKLFNIPSALAVGIFSGALTSTPGLAAALEATGNAIASIGYGIAYPFGVLGVVLFVQIFPFILRTDLKKEVEKCKQTGNSPGAEAEVTVCGKERPIERSGMLVLSVSLVLGLLLAEISLPLPGGGAVRLGKAGGPLMIGLLLGHLGKIGRYSLKVPGYTLNSLRELGLMLFLAGAGTSAGRGFLAVAAEYGWSLFVGGAVITIIPMFIGYYIAAFFRLDLPDALGAVCGGMTSTPALGALITASGTEDVAASYAAAYPIALVLVVVASQLLTITIP